MLTWSMSRTGISSKPASMQRLQRLLGDLVAGFGEDLAGRRVDQVLGDVLAVEILVGRAQGLQALLGDAGGRCAGVSFLPASSDHFAGVGVDQVGDGLHALHALGIEGQAPAALGSRV